MRSLRSRFALLSALLVAAALILFAGLSAGLFYYEQLDAFSEDHTRVPSKRDRREAVEGVLTLLSCDVLLLPAAVAVVGVIAWFCGRRVLAQLSALAHAADGISVHNLHRRISLNGTADETVRLTRAFNALLERLEQNVRQIQRFSADASHEFRLPLTLMKCEVESLLRDLSRDPTATEAFEGILLEIHRLNRICDSLLFLARADAGTIQLAPETVDISMLCEEILADFEVLAEPARIEVGGAIAPGLRLRGNELLVRRLLLNLLDNAFKYNLPGGWIRLVATGDRTALTLQVENSGPGIPSGDRAQLFQRFYRADPARRRETGGAGLGLSICREAALLHGGSIRLVCSSPERTCFAVTLPREPAAPTSLAPIKMSIREG